MKKKIYLLFLMIGSILLLTGCRNDNMDNIEIIVTNYPNEYIVRSLYSNHATISSIYPDGVDTSNYKISDKQKIILEKIYLYIMDY